MSDSWMKKAVSDIRKCVPALRIAAMEEAGEGMDSRTYLVNGRYIFRFPKFPHVAESMRLETMVLPKLEERVKVRIPRLEFIGEKKRKLLFVGYKKIEGVTLKSIWTDLPRTKQESILQTIGAFLEGIHSFPLEEAQRLGVPLQSSRHIHRGDFLKVLADIALLLPQDLHHFLRDMHRTYTDNIPVSSRQALLHADIASDHIFCDPLEGKVNGIIDFGDMGIGDPDYDLWGLFGTFGWPFIDRLLKYYQHDSVDTEALRHKLRFYLVHSIADDVWMGMDRNDENLRQWALGFLEQQMREMRDGGFY